MTDATPEPASVDVSVSEAPLLARTVTLKDDRWRSRRYACSACRERYAQIGLVPDQRGERCKPRTVRRRCCPRLDRPCRRSEGYGQSALRHEVAVGVFDLDGGRGDIAIAVNVFDGPCTKTN